MMKGGPVGPLFIDFSTDEITIMRLSLPLGIWFTFCLAPALAQADKPALLKSVVDREFET